MNIKSIIVPRSQGFTIFMKNWCAYSRKAMTALERSKLKFVYIDLDQYPNIEKKLFEYLNTQGIHSTTVPQIFLGNRYIGGYDELHNLLITTQL